MGKLIKSLILFLGIILGSVTSAAQNSKNNYALILSGGISKEDNFYRYFDNTIKLHKAYQSAGIKKENIITLYGSGTNEQDTRKPIGDYMSYDPAIEKEYFSAAIAFKKELGISITGAAKKKNLKEAFIKLSKQIKPGENLTIFITDHGSEENEINLWGETLSIEELKTYLNLIPKSVNIQIANNICYGGKMTELTDSNICVVSEVDDKHPSAGSFDESPFVGGYASKITNSSFAETFEFAKLSDTPAGSVETLEKDKSGKIKRVTKVYNVGATSSLIYFLTKFQKSAPIVRCDYQDSHLKNVKLIEDTLVKSSAVEKKALLVQELSGTQVLHQKYKKELEIYTKNNEYNSALRKIRQERDEARRKVMTNAKLLSEEKNKKTSEIDKNFAIAQRLLLEKDGIIRKKEFDQSSKIDLLKKEIEFLETADKDQFEKYNQIKSCMDRKL